MSQVFDRFKDASWFSKEEVNCIVGGAGGISSWLTVLLARAGFSTFVFDFDILEEHNLGGQLFPASSIGKYKVDALKDVVESFTEGKIITFNLKYEKSSMSHNIMFSGFDNMEARKVMFSNWKTYCSKLEGDKLRQAVFIDGRLLAEQMQIFAIRAIDEESITEYETNHLFNDSEVEDAPCTLKQTSHSAALIASLMVGIFTNHISNFKLNTIARAVPFKTEFFIPLIMLS